MNVFDSRSETMPRRELEQLQLERLQALLARVRRNVRYYRERLGNARAGSLSELAALPMTAPEDLAAAFPYGLLSLPLREVMRIHSTVGAGGSQLVTGLTRNDLANWGRLVARQFAAASLTSHDVIQVSVEGGALPGAYGYTLGAERIEASIIADDAAHISHQLELLRNYRATALITSPARAAALAALLEQQRVDPHALSLQTVLLTRPVGAAEREAVKFGLQADVRCVFGVPEVLEPGLCVECPHGRLHLNEDHFLAEVVDGELVLTTLTREAMPLLRYRTRVAGTIQREPCPCGRTGATLVPGGWLDGRFLINERWIHRAQIDAVIGRTSLAGHAFRAEVAAQKVCITARVAPSMFQDTMREMVAMKSEVEGRFQTELGVLCELAFSEPRNWRE